MSDFINREDARRLACTVCDCCGICDREDDCPISEKLNAIPAADVRKNVRGEWIDCDVNESGLEDTVSLLCNNCGNYTEFALVGTPKEVMDTMRFCPHCGSMNGGNEK